MKSITQANAEHQEAISKLNRLQRRLYDDSLTTGCNKFAQERIAKDLKLSLRAIEEAVYSPELRLAWDSKHELERVIRDDFCKKLSVFCNKNGFIIGQAIVNPMTKDDEPVSYFIFEDHHLYLARN